jgi:hypothetical protein
MELTWTANGAHWGTSIRPAPRVLGPLPEVLQRCCRWPVGG